MDEIEAPGNDRGTVHIPDAEKVGAGRLALILSNTVVCAPNLLLATQFAHETSFDRIVPAVWTGGLCLAGMGAATAWVGARAGLSTSMILQYPFGLRGGKIVNGVLLVSLLGLYAVTAALFGNALSGTIATLTGAQLPSWPFTLLGSALMIAVIIFGFRSLRFLASIAVPLLGLLILSLLYRALSGPLSAPLPAAPPPGGLDAQTVLSATIGSYILGIIVMPDMIRYTRTPRGGVFASAFALAVALPLFLSVGAYLALRSGGGTLPQVLTILGLGAPALLVLTMVSWTNNANNLYSGSLVFETILPGVAKWRLVVIAGSVGTAIAMLPVIGNYVPFLATISVLLPPLAGIYVSDYWFARHGRYDPADLGGAKHIDMSAFAVWAVAAAVGAAAANGISPSSGVPGLDALIAGFLLHAGTARVLRRGAVRS